MKKRAFTLIELLVVIAIIAMLTAIVLPSLQHAKEQAKSVYCKNNLRQMSIAATSYVNDFDGRFPIAHYSMQTTWAASLDDDKPDICVVKPPDEEEPESQSVAYNFNWDYNTVTRQGKTEITSGILWQGETVDKVNKCPSYKESEDGLGPFSGYNYNTSYIGHGENERYDPQNFSGSVIPHPNRSGEHIVMPAKASSIRSSGDCVLFGEGQYSGGPNKFMRSPIVWEGDTDWTLRLGGTQGFRHRQKTNVAWADGHVTELSEYFTDTHPKFTSQLDTYNDANKVKIGFLSSNNLRYNLK